VPDPKNSMPRASVLVAEANLLNCQLIEDALRRARKSFSNVRTTINPAEALSVIKIESPDVAIISVRLTGPVDGLDLLSSIHTLGVPTRTIMLLDSRDPELVVDALRFGAHGIIFRDEALRILIKCIRVVHNGQIWLDNANLEHLVLTLQKLVPLARRDRTALERLTEREKEIADGIAEGLSNRDVASRLNLSEHTVRNYLQHVFDKLGVSSRTELALYWLRRAS